jgi:energy-coupling factor transporter ATP-binding protein EcfA2
MRIELTLANYRCFPSSDPLTITLQPGSTALVGANNSGKSTVLRALYELRPLFGGMATPADVAHALENPRQAFSPPRVQEPGDVFSNTAGGDLLITLAVRGELPPDLGGPDEVTLRVDRQQRTWQPVIPGWGQPLGTAVRLVESVVHGEAGAAVDVSLICHACSILLDVFYVGAFRSAVGGGADLYDIRVGDAVPQAWRSLKVGPTKERHRRARLVESDIGRIFGFRSFEINTSERGDDLQVVVDGESYWLSELGAGLSQFIIVLTNIAGRHPSYLLIDEPEQNLHPVLQMDFLTTLQSYARDGLLFATHSIGLARAGAEWRHSMRRVAPGHCRMSPLDDTPRLSEFLGELSYGGYRELGFSKVLLVEGPTDVKTVQQFLQKYRKDHQVLLMPLGGRSMINGKHSTLEQLEELKRITPDLHALVDSDRPAPGVPAAGNVIDFDNICKQAGVACHVLERRATENYLTDAAVKLHRGPKARAIGHFDKLGHGNGGWNKNENWRIASHMTASDLDGTDLGRFLSSL